MKVLIASDIHGIVKKAEKLDELCEKEHFDKIIFLGDLLHNYYYYNSKEEYEVVNILNKRAKITMSVIGNCDRDYEIEKLNFPVLYEIDKIDLDGHEFYILHGHLYNKYASLIGNNLAFIGHSHIYNLKGNLINPGSVGLPRVNKESTCIIYNNHVLSLIDIDTQEILEKRSLK